MNKGERTAERFIFGIRYVCERNERCCFCEKALRFGSREGVYSGKEI